MPENETETQPEQQQRYISLLGRILIPSLLSGLIPLILIGFFAVRGFARASDVAEETARVALDDESLEALQLQAETIADNVTALLDQAVEDTLALALVPPDQNVYTQFYERHNADIVYPKNDFVSIVENIPLYRELVFIDLNGQEQLKVVNGQVMANSLLANVSQPENTSFGAEDYFAQVQNFKLGRLHVSPVTGWHAGQKKQPGNTLDSYRYVGSQFGRYEAVIRFITPHADAQGNIDGYVMLSLDHRHIIEQAIHFEAAQPGRVVWPDYTTGNYAVLFDHEGYTIAHPRLNRIRGLDVDGSLIPYWEEDTSRNDREQQAFNWAHAGFLNETFPAAYTAVMQSTSGYTTRSNSNDTTIVTYYEPIPFEYGVYADSGLFGGVTIGAGLESFHMAADAVGMTIEAQQASLQRNLLWITLVGIGLLVTAGVFIARSVTEPVRLLTQAAQRLEEGVLEAEMLDEIIDRPVQDEVGVLAAVFKEMAEKVQMREKKLKATVQKLKIEIDQQKSQKKVQQIVDSDFFRQLEKQADVMRERRDRKIEGEFEENEQLEREPV
ncbi:MAG: cache and HAMP domain-containing protein [Chloroflexota bacterium]